MFAIFSESEFDGVVKLHCNNIPWLLNDLGDLEEFMKECGEGEYILAKISPPLLNEEGLTKSQIEESEKFTQQIINAAQKMHSNEGIAVKVKFVAFLNKNQF